MTMIPSEIDLTRSFPPLVATFERTECEMTAVMMIRAMFRKGDVFGPVTPKEVADAMKKDFDEMVPVLFDLYRNPFVRIDVHGLIDRGYARWAGPENEEPDKKTSAVEFTEKGLAALEKHRKIGPSV